MSKVKTVAWIFFVTTLSLFPMSANTEAITKGVTLSITCAGCHGTDGKSSGAIPSIAGKSSDYINKAMLDYRDGKRPSTVMERHAKGYSNEEIKLIADYFASKK